MTEAEAPTVQLGSITMPDEAVTETFGILGIKGTGKSTTARVLAEGLLAAHLPVVIIDPTGAWWGLRSSADGKRPGYPVVIFGGDHADVPLEATAGELLADLVVDKRLPAVMDLDHLSRPAARDFTTDFLARLHRRNREVLHVVVDEADLFAPQTGNKGTGRALEAMDDLVRRGRKHGLGVTLISQRPQVLHNNLLSQVSVLVTHQMTAVRDINAVDEWVKQHADEDTAKQLKASLPSLPVGTAWFWSPGWLGILERTEIQRPQTYDSSATPRPRQKRAPVRQWASIDVTTLGEQIKATLERAEENDPQKLRAELATLRAENTRLTHELHTRPTPQPAEPTIVEVPVVDPRVVEQLEALGHQLTTGLDSTIDTARSMHDHLQTALSTLTAAGPAPSAGPTTRHASKTQYSLEEAPVATVEPVGGPFDSAADPSLPKAHRLILTVLAQHGTRSVTQVALTSGYSHKSGGFRNALSALRTAGHIEGRGDITITSSGLAAVGPIEPLPTGTQLRRWWTTTKLGKAERAILEVLADRWPNEVSIDEIARLTDYSAGSGGFRNALSRLRSLELASGRGALKIHSALVDD